MLDKIIKHKYEEIKSMVQVEFQRSKSVLDFSEFLKRSPLILEIKRKTPTNGKLENNQSIEKRALVYEKNGAGCISVLADSKYFGGSFDDIKTVKSKVKIPVLCKEFIVDEIQIENAYSYGADAVLLIATVHSQKRLKELYKKATELGLKVLFEIHEFDEFQKIKNLDVEMVGVNSRNLKTFKIDLVSCGESIKRLNGDYLKVAESGIKSFENISYLKEKGANGYLIGTTLMETNNLKEKIMELKKGLED